ncbi:MAG TPA: hypothetical protein VD993_01760 [Chitinophagaceae bacterium]|nr:hypothetical protein [Chitinophagaceae bacterium]
MKKLSVSIFALAILFTIGSAFTNLTFTGYRVFKVDRDVQPTSQQQASMSWYAANGAFVIEDATEFDLAELDNPTPAPEESGDEACEPSSLICLVQFKIDNDIVDTQYGVDIHQGSLFENLED